MNINQLNYFLVVAEMGSFTKAAERLFITQPSLSVGIQKLENNLGVRLFERRNNQIILTSAGKYFQYKAQDILIRFESVKNELRYNYLNHISLRIGILETLPLVPLTKLISNFGKAYPDIVIEQLSGDIVELGNWLERGNIDLAISILRDKEGRRTSQILFQENYLVAVAKGHPLAERKSLSFSELDGLPYIERIKCERRDELQRLFVERDILPKTTYRAAHDELCSALVAAGVGLAVMPGQSSISGIVRLPVSELNFIRQVSLIWKSDTDLKAVGLFHEFSTSYLAKNSLVSPSPSVAS